MTKKVLTAKDLAVYYSSLPPDMEVWSRWDEGFCVCPIEDHPVVAEICEVERQVEAQYGGNRREWRPMEGGEVWLDDKETLTGLKKTVVIA